MVATGVAILVPCRDMDGGTMVNAKASLHSIQGGHHL
jgi:hypothetical protein